MSYIAITSTEISAGKPLTNDLLNKVKDNFQNHEDRLSDIENGTIVEYPPIIMRVNGIYNFLTVPKRTGVLKTTCNFDMRITGVRLLIDQAGTSGSTEVDILTNSSGSFVSILTTMPSVPSTSGNDAISSNAVLDDTKTTLTAGNIIRLDLTSAQVNGTNFIVRIDYEKV